MRRSRWEARPFLFLFTILRLLCSIYTKNAKKCKKNEKKNAKKYKKICIYEKKVVILHRQIKNNTNDNQKITPK